MNIHKIIVGFFLVAVSLAAASCFGGKMVSSSGGHWCLGKSFYRAHSLWDDDDKAWSSTDGN